MTMNKDELTEFGQFELIEALISVYERLLKAEYNRGFYDGKKLSDVLNELDAESKNEK